MTELEDELQMPAADQSFGTVLRSYWYWSTFRGWPQGKVSFLSQHHHTQLCLTFQFHVILHILSLHRHQRLVMLVAQTGLTSFPWPSYVELLHSVSSYVSLSAVVVKSVDTICLDVRTWRQQLYHHLLPVWCFCISAIFPPWVQIRFFFLMLGGHKFRELHLNVSCWMLITLLRNSFE